MTPEEDKLLTLDQTKLDKFLNDHVETIRPLHNWILARAEELDTESIQVMTYFFNKFILQANTLIEREKKAMQRPMS